MFKLPQLSLCVIMGVTLISIAHFIAESVHEVGTNPSSYLIKKNISQRAVNENLNDPVATSSRIVSDILVKVPEDLIQSAIDDVTGEKQYFLSQIYKNGTKGVAVDMVLYEEWLNLAVEKNYVPAVYELAQAFREAFSYSKQEEAISLFARAAKENHGDSQYALALAYYDGDVLDQDYQAAYYWYSKAAENGVINATYAMGLMQKHGKGMPVNTTKAMSLFAKASEQNHVESQYILGLGYASGVGVEPNFERALFWLRKSMHGGNVEAWKALRKINIT